MNKLIENFKTIRLSKEDEKTITKRLKKKIKLKEFVANLKKELKNLYDNSDDYENMYKEIKKIIIHRLCIMYITIYEKYKITIDFKDEFKHFTDFMRKVSTLNMKNV